MNVLLLHPEDDLEQLPRRNWNLVIDFARAPAPCYQRWSQISGGSVVSLYDFSREVDDLHYLRSLLSIGMGRVVDRWGLDWWDIASLDISERLLQMVLLARLNKTLPANTCLFTSRKFHLAEALASFRGSQPGILPSTWTNRVRQAVSHYAKVVMQSDGEQLVQTAFDKFDSQHRLRRGFAPHVRRSSEPLVLAPSAYVNVSRSAVEHARVATDQKFLLVYARKSGKLRQVPGNMRTADLSAYFRRLKSGESRELLEKWREVSGEIAQSVPELRAADVAGVFTRVSHLIAWGCGIRDAWNGVLDSHRIVSCFCADNSNPYTRIPLMLCKARGIPSIACHHGALDFRMAFKRRHADRYLAKHALESDYLREVCGLDSREITLSPVGSAANPLSSSATNLKGGDWLVYFTEPYAVNAWRTDKVYPTILPELARLACQMGLKLVIKLHPFESVRHFRRLTRRLLSAEERARTLIVSAPFESGDWASIRVAVAVESSVAIECTQRGIPIFLMSWLRNRSYGYLRQFQKFKVGHFLHEASEIATIPERLQALESKTSTVVAGEEIGDRHLPTDRLGALIANG